MNLNSMTQSHSRQAPGWPMDSSESDHGRQEQAEPATPPCTIILASGMEDGGTRATLALSMACTALSLDADTHVFLVGKGSYWAYQGPGRAIQVNGFPALPELLADYLALGGSMGVCAACDEARCSLGVEEASLQRWPEIQVQGMATLMERMVDGRVVTF
jgi:predicted peroxiredoxin